MENLLFTGATGFVGRNIISILESQYSIETIGTKHENTYQLDIAKEFCLNTKYDIVIHAAGKAHSIPKNKEEEEVFFQVNLNGTMNLCKALEKSAVPKSFVFISSVAVYGVDVAENVNENYPLNGKTPYALSKIKSEKYLIDWCEKHNVILTILRPALIAGKNPPGNLGDMINGIQNNRYLSIGKASATKSIVMVEDLANVIIKIKDIGGIYNLCDDNGISFKELEKLIAFQLNKRTPISIPLFVARFLAICGDIVGTKFPINSLKLGKLIKPLTFSNEKLKKSITWIPLNISENFKVK